MDQSSAVWVIGTGIVGSLCTVVGVLWKQHQEYVTKQEKRAEEEQTKREATQQQLLELTEKVSTLKGQNEIADAIEKPLERLTRGVVKLLARNEQSGAQQDGD